MSSREYRDSEYFPQEYGYTPKDGLGHRRSPSPALHSRRGWVEDVPLERYPSGSPRRTSRRPSRDYDYDYDDTRTRNAPVVRGRERGPDTRIHKGSPLVAPRASDEHPMVSRRARSTDWHRNARVGNDDNDYEIGKPARPGDNRGRIHLRRRPSTTSPPRNRRPSPRPAADRPRADPRYYPPSSSKNLDRAATVPARRGGSGSQQPREPRDHVGTGGRKGRSSSVYEGERGRRLRKEAGKARSKSATASDRKSEKTWQDTARRALEAAAVAAIKSRGDSGRWLGRKGGKVATAALGAVAVDTLIEKRLPHAKGGVGHAVAREFAQRALKNLVSDDS
ncbi:hypothetical protein VTK73DRAFT_10396 [Phialemonium thermophilum]|uniref:Uncharacterized protein n=1 Tax=Phialemonium thermophilum TaxID=223376 RepID=A0ABR3XGR0_9PEZI